MDIKEIINELKNLDLSTYPKESIQKLLTSIGSIEFVDLKYHKGKPVMRARPNYNNERFSKKADFSFKPQEHNTSYQRASTPNNTMFYASTIPEQLEEGELDNMRVIGISETIPFIRDKSKSGYQKISFGKWIVEEDLNLMAIVHKDTYIGRSSFTKEIENDYKNFIMNYGEEIVNNSLGFHHFLADEFAKETINGDYDYMITALFTEIVTQTFGLDGILYPSVRVGGEGFNIAITPEATKKLRLYVAGECSIYKLKDKIVVGNDAIVELDGFQEEFELIDLENDEKICLAQLGLKSKEELSNN